MALSRDRNTHEREGHTLELPVAAATQIHAGSLVVVGAAGFAAPGSTALNLRAAGRAEVAVDNSAGANGAETVKVRRGCFKFRNSGADPVGVAHVLGDCYIVDDETVAATDGAGTRSRAGKVLAIDSDGVWVEIR